MKLPQGDKAIIEPTKVRDYLLSTSHPIGRFKAAFFRSLGYTDSDWLRLADDLRRLAVAADATLGATSAYGQKYEARGILSGPTGQQAPVVTVWIVLTGDVIPRLVTAYPRANA